MKETPIIMSGNHPKLILDGIKTQNRRVIKIKGVDIHDKKWINAKYNSKYGCVFINDGVRETWSVDCPYGQVGDRLWVRETFCDMCPEGQGVCYKSGAENQPAMDFCEATIWKPSIHMFRKDSRILLEITGIRVERVQDISGNDCRSEGIMVYPDMPAGDAERQEFGALWDSLNAKRGYGWETNPWVWCLSFKKLD